VVPQQCGSIRPFGGCKGALFLFFFFSQIKMDVILRHWQTFEAEIKHA
jgi:hypothetical protein